MKKILLILFITGVCFGQTYELAEEFYSNGFPKVIKTYKVSKGKIEIVKRINWHFNGQKEKVMTYKDGERDGKWTRWNENGQKSEEGTYKDGIEDGLSTWWYKNGQKWREETYKDGKKDGLYTRWYENGQKESEGTFKDGKRISSKRWNEDGTEE